MTLTEKAKRDNEALAILKGSGMSEVRHLIHGSDRGDLTLILRKGERTYVFYLDAVPVGKNEAKELFKIYKDKIENL